jgi:hypothetical protein
LGQSNSQNFWKDDSQRNDLIKNVETSGLQENIVSESDIGSDKHFDEIVLEEFKVLKQESLRLNQDIATIIWVGLSGFSATIAASFVLLNSTSIVNFLPLIICILSLQSLALGAMFSFEVQRYARIGKYIRIKIEKFFFLKGNDDPSKNPLYWEHWLINKRSTWFYFVSGLILQLPIIITAFVLVLPEKWLTLISPSIFKNTSLLYGLVKILHNKFEFWVFSIIILFDFAIIACALIETFLELKSDTFERTKIINKRSRKKISNE